MRKLNDIYESIACDGFTASTLQLIDNYIYNVFY